MSSTSTAIPAAASASFLLRGAIACLTGLPDEAARHEGPDLRVENGVITALGRLAPRAGERVHDVSGCVVYPGWINTHHHLFQSVMKGAPEGMNAPLRVWSQRVAYEYRRGLDADALETAALVGIVELMRSGTTTVADHHFAFSPSMSYDAADILFDVAKRLGVRYVFCRGGATVPRAYQTTIEPFAEPETVDGILASVQAIASRHHDASPTSAARVVVAPTTLVWSIRPGELRELARGARALGLRLHSHLAETRDDMEALAERHGLSPAAFAEREEWLGADTWFAHLVHVNDRDVESLARSGTGISHCPQSNARLGSGVASVVKMRDAGMPISLAVDGAASNEAADMISEVHAAWQIHRATGGPDAVTAEDVVHWGTAGGARVLGLSGVGTLAPGQAADIAVYALDDPRYFGLHDPAIGPVIAAGRPRIRLLFRDGRLLVEDDRIPGVDLHALRERAERAAQRVKP